MKPIQFANQWDKRKTLNRNPCLSWKLRSTRFRLTLITQSNKLLPTWINMRLIAYKRILKLINVQQMHPKILMKLTFGETIQQRRNLN